MFHRSFKCNSRKFQGCFKKVSRVYHESFKGVSWKFQGCFKGDLSRMFQESLKDVSRKSKGCFEGVLRVFQGSFKKTFRVFQKSFMLHGTHRSFPSRRRACFSHRRSAQIKKRIWRKLLKAPENPWFHPFPDTISHLGAPGGRF